MENMYVVQKKQNDISKPIHMQRGSIIITKNEARLNKYSLIFSVIMFIISIIIAFNNLVLNIDFLNKLDKYSSYITLCISILFGIAFIVERKIDKQSKQIGLTNEKI